MDFNLMDSFFHDKKPEKPTNHYQETSDYEYSTNHFTMTAPQAPFYNAYTYDATTRNAHFVTTPYMDQNPIATELSLHKSNGHDSMEGMREMIFRMAMMQPVQIDPEAVKAPKRKNVRISKDPQSVAARHRRERISERIRILQRMVPGGTKLDTASMLDEAVLYLKFLKKQLHSLEQSAAKCNRPVFPIMPGSNYMQML